MEETSGDEGLKRPASFASCTSSLPPPISSDNEEAADTSTDTDLTDRRLDTLEQSGRYLLSIPRYDVQSLQSCPEYKQFLDALDMLGEAHRRCVFMRNCEIQVQSNSDDEQGEEEEAVGGSHDTTARTTRSTSGCEDVVSEVTECGDSSGGGVKSPALGSVASHTCTTGSSCSNSDPYSPTPTSPPSASDHKSLSGMLASASVEDTGEGPDDLPPLEDPNHNSAHHPSTSSTRHSHRANNSARRSYSLLQHLPSDDELLRILEYLNCRHLIQMGNTCHRFHELSEQSAVQRTGAYATDGMTLRASGRNDHSHAAVAVAGAAAGAADAQDDDGNEEDEAEQDNFVPVNIGVGHLFIPLGGHAEPAIPPSSPTRSAAVMQRGDLLPGGSAGPMQLLRAYEQAEGISPRTGPFVRMPFLGLPRRVSVNGCEDEEFNGIYFCTGCNGNGFVFTKPREPRRRIRTVVVSEVTAAAAPAVRGDEAELVGNEGRDAESNVGTEQIGRLLRINIAKKFSNETILWYMSKEVETIDDNGVPSIAQVYCYWAKLMARGQGSSDDAMYPSQTSSVTRTGDRAWQGLGMMRDTAPPVVELLD